MRRPQSNGFIERLHRTLVDEPLVRPLVVKALDEVVELGLLLQVTQTCTAIPVVVRDDRVFFPSWSASSGGS